jgi:hypothetical protein
MKSICMIWLFAILVSTSVLAQSNPVPFVSQPLVPTSVAPGGSGFTLTINGAGFGATSVVNWNGSTLPTTVVSSTKLTVKVPAAKVRDAGTAVITVNNANMPMSNQALFSVGAQSDDVQFGLTKESGSFSGNYLLAEDLNNDGIPDLARGTGDQGGIWILPGKSDGTFGDLIYSPCDTQPHSQEFTSADFNGDGKLDLLNAYGDYDAQVCLGNGDGSFTPLPSFTIPQLFTDPAVGDFNGDGKLDLALADRNYLGDGFLQIFLGNGDGTFLEIPPAIYQYGLWNVAVGDFNHDGKLDLATAGGSLGVLIGNGDGTFQPIVFYSTGSGRRE